LLLLSVDRAFDKDLYLRYLAASLSSTNQQLPAKEWISSNENNSLALALQKEAPNTIFVIDNIHPKEVNFDLLSLKQIAQTKNAYILISTDVSHSIWKLDPAIQKMYCHELNSFQYERDDLKNELGKALRDSGALIFSKLTDQIKKSLLNETNLYKISTTLATPEKIHLFVQYLSAHPSPITEKVVREAAQMAIQQKDTIAIRTFNGLQEFEKFIVLGLSFFDGFFDDQFFAAMHLLAKENWAIRNAQLEALDYGDLAIVSNFFYFSEVGKDTRLIKTKFSKIRQLLLQDNWDIFRRHLLKALSVISKLVTDSVDDINSNWELYGTREKRQRLRVILGDTISDFGVHSPSSVQRILVTLASHSNITIQRVAAKAIARWRQHGKDQLLYDTLKDWQGESRFAKLVEKMLLDQGIDLNRRSALNYIRATVVLTLGYASIYDKPDELSDKIIHLFTAFLSDTSQLVKNRIEFIVPQIVHHHATKLYNSGNGILIQFIDHFNLIFPTALGLSRALVDYPQKTRKLMHLWVSQHRKHGNFFAGKKPVAHQRGCLNLFGLLGKTPSSPTPAKVDESSISQRDRVIITLIFTCQELIILKDEHALVTSKSAIEMLFDLLQTEQHPIIKELLFDVLTTLMDEQKPHIADHLIQQLKDGEEEILIGSLGERYLEERSNLSGGDRNIEVESGTYRIWIDSQRPPTYIEKLMKDWLIDGNQRQRQLAFKALLHFANLLDTYEGLFVRKELERRAQLEKAAAEEARLAAIENQKELSTKALEDLKKAALSHLKRKWNLTGISAKNKEILNDIYPVIENKSFRVEDLETVASLLEKDNSISSEISKKIRTLWERA
ncbi:MAG: hypothetical protein AAF705_01535, partial [Bacteroidota bacterium]